MMMPGYPESALVREGGAEKNTIPLQKPFTVKKPCKRSSGCK